MIILFVKPFACATSRIAKPVEHEHHHHHHHRNPKIRGVNMGALFENVFPRGTGKLSRLFGRKLRAAGILLVRAPQKLVVLHHKLCLVKRTTSGMPVTCIAFEHGVIHPHVGGSRR